MTKNSKRRKRKAERKESRLAWDVAQTQQSARLPPEVAQSPKLPDYLDGSNYQLILEKYNHKQCGLPDLDKTSAKALIEKLSAITRYNSKNIAGSNLVRDRVNKSGPYKPFFEDLEDDIELREIQYAGTGRIFCYFVNDYPQNEQICNYCCIVAIRRQHI